MAWIAVTNRQPYSRRYASHSFHPAYFAVLYASDVGSIGPVPSDSTRIGCGACFGYAHELARYTNFDTPNCFAASSTLSVPSRLSRISSTGCDRFSPIPPLSPAQRYTTSGRVRAKKAAVA